MADYSDLKISPKLRDVLETAAKDTYDRDYRAISIAGHEAAIAWLVLRADPDVMNAALDDHGFDDLDELVAHLSEQDGGDGRFSRVDDFDPLAAIRTPRELDDDVDADTDT